MVRSDVDALYDEVLRHRRLLEHPFYRRWEAGELAPGELTAYAGQYRHFERALPGVLAEVARTLPEGEARRLVESNLHDELADPEPHVALFDRFADAVGAAGQVEATPATTALVDLYRGLASADPVAALGAVGAYEVQSPAIAQSKALGLRSLYGLTSEQTRFWDVHGTMDVDHASWTLDALVALDTPPQVLFDAAAAAASAWWAFLDERQEAAAELASR
ncbi:MAG TPA: iron-containing redox enzyme family protein [Acidimicrobiales bacterium]|nr:iron-containing redox enzyme family protein [Acidimicrobiales bacterium]